MHQLVRPEDWPRIAAKAVTIAAALLEAHHDPEVALEWAAEMKQKEISA